jgi:hypothetical protein
MHSYPSRIAAGPRLPTFVRRHSLTQTIEIITLRWVSP